jgi:prepilin-type N-terminal cleavage/methylation domain-containing protein
MKALTRKRGFTIVEVIIVVAIIGILAGLTIFAIGSWRARTAKTEMKNELQAGYSTAKNYRTFNNIYPNTKATFDGLYSPKNSVVLTYNTTDSGVTYCLKATSPNDSSIWYVSGTVTQPTTTAPSASCP